MSEHKNPFPGENNTGHFWDDENDIRELDNRPPRWYMQSMFVGIIAIVIYSIYYPSIPWFGDHYKGAVGWTQITEMNEKVAELEAHRVERFAKEEADISQKTVQEILANDELKTYAVKTARVLFGDNCAACHGAAGQGNEGFPVLADDDWLYGGKIGTIYTTIVKGRKGNMPAKMGGVTEKEAGVLADFLIATGKGEQGSAAGKTLYMSKGCVGCHAPNMKGMQVLGSVNLSDGIYRFKAKDQKASIVRTIMFGVNQANPHSRKVEMPKFGDSKVISASQLKKLAIYVHQLGGGE
jgi:cytochrome c oxidase cbb3-type subunit 3